MSWGWKTRQPYSYPAVTDRTMPSAIAVKGPIGLGTASRRRQMLGACRGVKGLSANLKPGSPSRSATVVHAWVEVFRESMKGRPDYDDTSWKSLRDIASKAKIVSPVVSLLQGPSFAAAHCFEARDVSGNAQATPLKGRLERFSLKAEPYGRRSFIHCGKKHRDDDDDDY
ncbi:hypothetical protein VP01_2012g4 [Puccinia sorghi]|uniref:Uncharacterized protein n=1 Tax=Puccinia sorghi TaxID=27349 RepID=A0A0L6VBU8_9BASI|nr:hypothetical protein VP01_2012g4 [Puccinia sorghi]